MSTGGDWFAEAAEGAGLDFVHVNGASGAFYYPEILGPWCRALRLSTTIGDLDAVPRAGRSRLARASMAVPR